jgi:RimJ/RimL family protein N-acetyltransferase
MTENNIDYLIRDLEPKDWVLYWIFCFENRNHLDTFNSIVRGTESWGPDEYFQAVEHLLCDENFRTVVCIIDDRIAAIAKIEYRQGMAPHIMGALHYQYRGRGYAPKFLLDILNHLFKVEGFSVVKMYIDESNIASRKTIERLGGVPVMEYVYPEGHPSAGYKYFMYGVANFYKDFSSDNFEKSVV